MKIHEYQGKKLLDHFKIKIPKSRVLFSLEQGIQIIKDFHIIFYSSKFVFFHAIVTISVLKKKYICLKIPR